MYRVTKTYGHEEGLSVCFRQWRTHSHCNRLHGYALSVSVELVCRKLDPRNWVFDFGGFKPFRDYLHDCYDHVLIVAKDDPEYDTLFRLASFNKVCVIDHTGCEAFAHAMAEWLDQHLQIHHRDDYARRGLRVHSLTVAEHGGNCATYYPENHYA